MGVANMLHKESSKMVSLRNSCTLEEKTQKPVEPMCKRRKVFGVRDFPPGCGPLAPVRQPAELEAANSEKAEVGDGIKWKRTLDSSPADGPLAHSGTLTKKPDLFDGNQKMEHVVDFGAQEKALKERKPMKGLDIECSDPVEDSHQIESGINFLKKVRVRNYPPQRKVFGVRDFPPLCGPKAPHVAKEGGIKTIQSENDLGQKKSENDGKTSENTVSNDSDVNAVIKHVLNGIASEGYLENEAVISAAAEQRGVSLKPNGDTQKASSSYEKMVESEVIRGRKIKSNCKNSQCERSRDPLMADVQNEVNVFVKNPSRDIVVYDGGEFQSDRSQDVFSLKERLLDEGDEDLQFMHDRLVVQGLMASAFCPWRQLKGSPKPERCGASVEKNVKKNEHALLSKQYLDSNLHKKKSVAENTAKANALKKKSSALKNADQGRGQLVLWQGEDLLSDGGDNCKQNGTWKSCEFEVSLPPCSGSVEGQGSDSSSARSKVREALRLFQVVYRKLLQDEESKPKAQGDTRRRLDCQAAKILKEKGKYVNRGKAILGPVPGVEVGDEFQYMVELNIVGLHRQTQSGIDYKNEGGKIIATSIVASGGYDDNLDNSDVLIYTGQGGNVMQKGKQPEDQKLERGNLALANSRAAKSPVRVIRGESKSSDSPEARGKTYIYDGLYLVKDVYQEVGQHGKLVFKFKLERIAGQPELSWKVVKKSKKSTLREGLCVLDISEGKELMPISAVNTIDDEKPPPFVYVTGMIYPDWCHPIPLKGCDCIKRCTESTKCVCVMKNGGEIPYNHNGAIVEMKNLVYECGPTCKCPPSCYNRVTQHGIKFQMEIFKTESRGWGVRSLKSIPSGSFICEYVGELLEDREAEQRTGSDEYLFDIGNNYNDGSLRDGLSSLMPEAPANLLQDVPECGFTIDAAHYGNLGRFINHSCSPNLYAQNVLYDHEDRRIPHVMLFAVDNIPPLQELTYHYNYVIGEVRDANGNIKVKSCYCGSSDCTDMETVQSSMKKILNFISSAPIMIRDVWM